MEQIIETVVVLLSVGIAVLYLGKNLFLAKKSGCGGGCNKCGEPCEPKIKHYDTSKVIKIHLK
jgi:hypothetical protein